MLTELDIYGCLLGFNMATILVLNSIHTYLVRAHLHACTVLSVDLTIPLLESCLFWLDYTYARCGDLPVHELFTNVLYLWDVRKFLHMCRFIGWSCHPTNDTYISTWPHACTLWRFSHACAIYNCFIEDTTILE